MHPCLRLEEITSLVCAELTCDRKDRNFVDTNSLLNVALTSKVLLEPALRALWRKQSSLRPLFLLLPEDLWGNVDVHQDDDSEHDVDLKSTVPPVCAYAYSRRKNLF